MACHDHNKVSFSRPAQVLREVIEHAPYTLLGAATGLAGVILLRNIGLTAAHGLFLFFHPAHVLFSAIVTTSLYKLREGKAKWLAVVIVGYVGSVGIATFSDCLLPFLGEQILSIPIPTEAAIHGHTTGLHIGFIEDWYVVNPAALLGISLAFFWPHTKLPHAAHILLSTWASAAHILMNIQAAISAWTLIGILLVLFIAVWVPCCLSDIVFPMLFVKQRPGPERIGTAQEVRR